MINFTIRIIPERSGEGVGAEFKIGYGAKRPTETEFKALSLYFCPRLEEMARSLLGTPKEWHVATLPQKP